jgi:hypothetical protein
MPDCHSAQRGASTLIAFSAIPKLVEEDRDHREFILAPKHADLIRSRESKREAEAFERGEYLESTGHS